MAFHFTIITFYESQNSENDFIKTLCESKNVKDTRDVIDNGSTREVKYLINKLNTLPIDQIPGNKPKKCISDLLSVKGMGVLKQKKLLKQAPLARVLPSFLLLANQRDKNKTHSTCSATKGGIPKCEKGQRQITEFLIKTKQKHNVDTQSD